MKRNKSEISILLLVVLFGIVLIPAVSAQEEKDYNITAEKALEHANAHMIHFLASEMTEFKEWEGASLNPKPLELYDINGQKLFYQFSVYKNNEMIGRIDIGADKKLGQSVKVIEFDPKPFNASEAMKKSIEIAENKYPAGKVESTKMVVYNYPDIGAMTTVKDKTTGSEYRIFVDVYTLNVVPDRPATETDNGVWSLYEQKLKNGIEENLKDWQNSSQFTKSIEQEATKTGINISMSITEEEMKILSNDSTIKLAATTATEKTLSVPLYGQEKTYYCAPASAQMIAAFYNVTHTQDYIYGVMGATAPNSVTQSQQLVYYKSEEGLHKTRSVSVTSGLTYSSATTEIDRNKPFKSGITNHARVCKGYRSDSTGNFLKINDPGNGGSSYLEGYPSSEINRIYVRV